MALCLGFRLNIKNYKLYLSNMGITLTEARLISYEELEDLGCSGTNYTCEGAPNWVYSTTYWLGSAGTESSLYRVIAGGPFYGTPDNSYSNNYGLGVRPVITISKS